jgi:3-oxoacyl-[acyl-carrier-protein] synthase-1
MIALSHIQITPDAALLNGDAIATDGCGHEMLTALYRARVGNYPKFFKMDTLSRLGFLATELLLDDEAQRYPEATPRFAPREDRALVFCNRSASLCTDRHYQETIREADNFYPSPSVFVYTLPNIVTGEVAIRNKYYGETSFYVMEQPDAAQLRALIEEALQDPATQTVVGGWLECATDDVFEADLWLYRQD